MKTLLVMLMMMMTSQSAVVLEKLIVFKHLTSSYKITTVRYCNRKSKPPILVLSQINPIDMLTQFLQCPLYTEIFLNVKLIPAQRGLPPLADVWSTVSSPALMRG
jgi:hypothetical protein